MIYFIFGGLGITAGEYRAQFVEKLVRIWVGEGGVPEVFHTDVELFSLSLNFPVSESNKIRRVYDFFSQNGP